jgi:hypothetical protein
VVCEFVPALIPSPARLPAVSPENQHTPASVDVWKASRLLHSRLEAGARIILHGSGRSLFLWLGKVYRVMRAGLFYLPGQNWS